MTTDRDQLREDVQQAINDCRDADNGAMEDLLHRVSAALANTLKQSAGLDRDYTKRRIKELTDEGDGFWRPCSGCQESSDGYVSTEDYPYSDTFRCQPGSGCGECGGIGVIWDDTDWEDYAKFALSAPPDPEQAPALTRTDALAEARDVLETARDYVSDASRGLLTYEGSGDGFVAMAQEDLVRIDAALSRLNAQGEVK